MKKTNLFEKLSDLKERFASFFQHKKKITALENYSYDAKFVHKKYLNLVKECINDCFLGSKESEFLDYMLDRYEVNYLDWAHRTKWLKQKMRDKEEHIEFYKPKQMWLFDKPKETPIHIPVEILGRSEQSRRGKRA